MKKLFSTAVLLCCLAMSGQAQDLGFPSIGAGFHGTFPAGGGLSGKFRFTPINEAQVMIGFFGVVNMYIARYNHYLGLPSGGAKMKIQPYAFAQSGVISYDLDNALGLQGNDDLFETESGITYGAGGGIEYWFPEFTDDLRFVFDLGLGGANLEHYEFKSIMFGTGIHYHFGL